MAVSVFYFFYSLFAFACHSSFHSVILCVALSCNAYAGVFENGCEFCAIGHNFNRISIFIYCQNQITYAFRWEFLFDCTKQNKKRRNIFYDSIKENYNLFSKKNFLCHSFVYFHHFILPTKTLTFKNAYHLLFFCPIEKLLSLISTKKQIVKKPSFQSVFSRALIFYAANTDSFMLLLVQITMSKK